MAEQRQLKGGGGERSVIGGCKVRVCVADHARTEGRRSKGDGK